MEKLKQCPYCGGDAWIYNTNTVFVECKSCHASGPYMKTTQAAIAAWNSMHRTLRWTKEPPTEPGWYFCQRICPGAPKHYPLRVVHIHYDECMGKRVLCYGGCAWYGVEDDRQDSSPLCDISKSALEEMYWAGPIQEPLDTLPNQ